MQPLPPIYAHLYAGPSDGTIYGPLDGLRRPPDTIEAPDPVTPTLAGGPTGPEDAAPPDATTYHLVGTRGTWIGHRLARIDAYYSPERNGATTPG